MSWPPRCSGCTREGLARSGAVPTRGAQAGGHPLFAYTGAEPLSTDYPDNLTLYGETEILGGPVSGRDVSGLAESLVSEPAEDSGSDTASRYNFQYLCAARHCFALLNDSRLAGVVCEWHVDYVLLYSDGTNELVSVKHRELRIGPWPFSELWTKGGLTTLHERWKATPGARCRLVTNGAMKSGRDLALEFANDLSGKRIDKYIEDVSGKLGCSLEEARSFLLSLRVEHGIPDRVTLRSHQIVHTVEGALAAADLTHIEAAIAWDTVVSLVASKSRDFDNRDFSSIDLASPSALDEDLLMSAKIARRTITRADVIDALSSPPKGGADLPLVSNLWMREPSATFIGRDEVMQEIRDHCQSESQSQPAIVTLGMSGVGKTEILAQYAWQHAEDYQFIWWVRADSWDSVISDLTFLAERLGLPAPDSEDGLRQLKQYFLGIRGLLLLDGATTDPSIIKFIPKKSATRFLISSLDQGWAAHLPAIHVMPLADSDANVLLASTLSSTTHESLTSLNKELNGLPLALKQAAGYISASGIPVEVYSEMIHDRASELLRRSAPPEHVGLTAAISITIDRLQTEDPDALAILHLLSFLAPHGFPTELFTLDLLEHVNNNSSEDPPEASVEIEHLASAELRGMSEPSVQLLHRLKDRLALFDAVAALQRFSLVEAQQGGITCHALTQAIVRQSLTDAEKRSAIESAVSLLNKVANLNPLDSRYWPHYRHMMPHFVALIAYLESGSAFPLNSLMFYSALAMNLGQQGAKEASLTYAQKAVAEGDRLSTLRVDTLVFVRMLLVEALTGTDRWDDALRVADEGFTLAKERQASGFSVGTLHTKKAAVLHLQGKLEEALIEFDKAHTYLDTIENMEEALSISRAIKANKATLRREIGDANGAITEFKELIAQYPEDASKNGLASLYSNLSLSYLDATKFAEALSSSMKALDIDYKNSDGLNSDSARDWNNAGLALLELDKADEAAEAFEASLQIHEHLSRRKSTASLIVRMNLGRAQMAQGDFVAARKILDETLKHQESILGPDHRDVAATLVNLSVAYSSLQQFGNAASAAHRAIKIDMRVYGESHPELIPDYHNMASALMLSFKYRAALKWLSKALRIAMENFDSGNVRVGICLEKVGICKYCCGGVIEGMRAMLDALAIFEAKLGSEHPETRSCRSILAQMMQGENPLELAARN